MKNGTVRAVERKSDTESAVRFTVGVILFIPIAAYFLLKWLLQGLIRLITVIRAQQKTGKKPGVVQKESLESPGEEDAPDFRDEDSEFEDSDEEWDNAESIAQRLPAGPQETDQIRSGGPVKNQPIKNIAERKDDPEMATIIGAGKYVFGEDLPMGKYNLKVVSGSGGLTIRYGDTEDDENWIDMGMEPDQAREYRNLSLERGRYFMLDDCLRVEITRSKMLEIDP